MLSALKTADVTRAVSVLVILNIKHHFYVFSVFQSWPGR